MSSQALGDTGSGTIERLAVVGRPAPTDLVDAGFVVGLGMLALWGLRTSFDSLQFLVAGTAGLLLGVAVAHIAVVLGRSWPVIAVMGVVAYFLFGGIVTMRSEAIAGVLPGFTVLARLGVLPVRGWMEFLTTLPPVDGGGQFLVLPYLLGLLVGVAGHTWARRSTHMAWPVSVPVAAFVLVILLGTLEPVAAGPRGLALAVGSCVWVGLRRRRRLQIVGTGAGRLAQAAIGAALVAAALATATVGTQLTSAPSKRLVLRTLVQPPFDITSHPSPLVGFRTYTQGAQRVWDQPLFMVTGLQAGERVRIAVLDEYSGTVWAAGSPTSPSGGGFRRVGTNIASAPDDPHTAPRMVTLQIHKAYAALNDVNLWVPGLGSADRITFEGPDAATLSGALRYDTVTGQAVVSQRLREGDRIQVRGRPVAKVPDTGVIPGGGSLVDPGVGDFVAAPAVKLAGNAPSTPWAAVTAAGAALRTQGAYSDGTATGESQYLPGHGAGRLARFLTGRQFVGNDEQYASTFALVANTLGVPARVVLGAVVPEGGTVKGMDVHAWVEVKDASGQWFAVPQTMFMPERDKHPQQDPPPAVAEQSAAKVPPPNMVRPPGALDSLLSTQPGQVRPPRTPIPRVPAWVWQVMTWTGIPLGLLAAVTAGIAAAHGVRARRRRLSGPPSRRFAHGWTELVDRARDLGIKVPTGLTRREQGRIISFAALAAEADAAVFGPGGDPSGEAIDRYWKATAAARRDLTRKAGTGRRLLRRFTLTSLLLRDPRPVEVLPKSVQPRTRRTRGMRAVRSGA